MMCSPRGRLATGFVSLSELTAAVNKTKAASSSSVPSQPGPGTLAKIRGRFRGNVPFAAWSGRGRPSCADVGKSAAK